MDRIQGRFSILLGALLLALAPARAAEVVAMVADVQGRCTVRDAGGGRPCAILDYLVAGERVALASGTLALVYLRTSQQFDYAQPTEVAIEANAPRVVTGRAGTSTRLGMLGDSGLRPLELSGLAQAAIVMRGVNPKRKIELLSPRNGKILSLDPEFRWQAMPSAVEYRFTLLDEFGRQLHAQPTAETQLRLPAAVRLADRAYYEWRLDARVASGEVYSATGDFATVSAARRERLAAARPGPDQPFSARVVYATLLQQEGFRDAAVAEWRALSAARPGDAKLRAYATQ